MPIPEYASQPLDFYRDYWLESTGLLQMTIDAITDLTAIPKLFEGFGYGKEKGILRAKTPEKERRSGRSAPRLQQ